MTDLNRTVAPENHPIDSIDIFAPEQFKLSNSIPVYSLSAGSHEVVKVEVIFNAGAAHHANPLIPSFTSSMLEEGTKNKTAAQIADAIDDYGAFLEVDHDKDFSSVILYSLNKYLPQTLPVILEIITEASFPEPEWEIMRSNRLQHYQVNLGKVSYLAGKKFQELLFRGTAYGTPFGESEYRKATAENLNEFWKGYFNLSQCQVLLSGKIDDLVKETVSDVFGHFAVPSHSFNNKLLGQTQVKPIEREHFVLKEDAIQSAIRIGRRLFPKNHPDYFSMKVLSTVLGGYFGSRLMSNIREDKGYTYGIGSGISALKEDGFFYISTEVGSDVCKAALQEIYAEISLLQQELVPIQELQLVKNYLLGNLLKSFDGPFERMDRFKGTHFFGLDLNFFHRYTDAIRNTTPEQLQRLAQVWLQKDDLIELVVGRK
jgi:predicted Zn-dependent peptidase